jgi:hypothetical protein
MEQVIDLCVPKSAGKRLVYFWRALVQEFFEEVVGSCWRDVSVKLLMLYELVERFVGNGHQNGGQIHDLPPVSHV